MLDFLYGLATVDVIGRVSGFIGNFTHADSGSASGGAPAALVRSISGANRHRFYVPFACEWSGAQIEAFLRYYGIRIWDQGFDGENIYFTVKRRQANWAEYLLLRRGIPLAGALFNPQNAVYGQQHAPGDRPPAWADEQGRSRGWFDDLLDL